jgi:nucleoside transporter
MTSQRWKLSTMMFLNIFMWGAWLPIIPLYLKGLGFNPDWQQPLIMGTFNVAALVAMFFGTQFADRHFSAEKFLAFSMLVAGVAMLALKWTTGFWAFFALMLLHSLFYVPTISITNSIAFAHLRDPQREFGYVRLWGTIGWIAAAWPFVLILVDWGKMPALGQVSFGDWFGALFDPNYAKQGEAFTQAASAMFIAAGGAALLLAGFSMALPHTPPRPAGQATESLAWLEALKLLSLPYVLVLFIVTFFDSAVHQVYFFMTGKYLVEAVHIPSNWVTPVMSIGQIAEIATMALLGIVLKRLGWRLTMVLGILGHAVRFTVFALYPNPWVAITANLLHGICYAFFFATVYIFVDEFFPKDARSSAQALFNFLILGLGPLVGNFVAGQLEARFTDPEGHVNFRGLFLVPAVAGLAAAVFLFLFFHPPAKAAVPKEDEVPQTVH